MKQNSILKLIAAAAMVLTIAVMSAQAAGAVTVGTVGFPTDVAVDIDGKIYVTETDFNNIDIINTDGTRQLVGVGLIEFPSGVAVSAGNIYVADEDNNSIKVFSSTTGDLVNTVGTGLLNSPNGVAVDSAGNIYVADSGNDRIQIFKSDGSQQTVGTGLNFPSGVAVDSAGNIYVADSGNDRILKYNSAGILQQTILGFNFPNDVDVDNAGNIYIADTGNDDINVFNSDGVLKRIIGSRGAADGQFNLPMGVAVNSAGTSLYVADADNNRVQVIAIGDILPPAAANITGFISGNGIRGGTIEARVSITNTGASDQTYVIVVSGVNSNGYPLAGTGTLMLAAGQSMNNVPVLVAVPAVQPVGSYNLLAGVYPIATYPDGLIMARPLVTEPPVTATVS